MDLNVPIVNKRMVFLLYSSINILLRVLSFSFGSSPRARMFEMATSLCFFFRISAVAIVCLDVASGGSPLSPRLGNLGSQQDAKVDTPF